MSQNSSSLPLHTSYVKVERITKTRQFNSKEAIRSKIKRLQRERTPENNPLKKVTSTLTQLAPKKLILTANSTTISKSNS